MIQSTDLIKPCLIPIDNETNPALLISKLPLDLKMNLDDFKERYIPRSILDRMPVVTSYRTNNGQFIILKTGSQSQPSIDKIIEVAQKYYLIPGQRVETPKGQATFLGNTINFTSGQEMLAFHVDGHQGASYWNNILNSSDLIRENFLLIAESVEPRKYREGIQFRQIDDGKEALSRWKRFVGKSFGNEVVFSVGNEQEAISVPKNFIVTCSPFFKALLDGRFKEGQTLSNNNGASSTTISLECPLEIFKEILEYLYTGEIKLRAEDILELAIYAERFQIDNLLIHCQEFMNDILTADTVLEYLAHISKMEHPLKPIIQKFIGEQSSEIIEALTEYDDKAIAGLSEDDLIHLSLNFQSNALTDSSISKFLKFLAQWKNATQVEDSALRKILDSIDITNFSYETILKEIYPLKLYPEALLLEKMASKLKM